MVAEEFPRAKVTVVTIMVTVPPVVVRFAQLTK